MNRRKFLLGLGAAIAEPIVEAPIRRVYSFIWTPPEPRIVHPLEIDMEERTRRLMEMMGQNQEAMTNAWRHASALVQGAAVYMMASKGWLGA